MKIRKEILRFLSAGIIVNATDFMGYWFLFHFMPFCVAKGISFICAAIIGYLFNKYWTFKSPESSYAQVSRYIVINFMALAINVLINQSVLGLWHGSVLWALIIATMLTGLFTFASFKWWVF